MVVRCLARSLEVVMDRKMYSVVYQAAVTLVPPLSRELGIFKIKFARKRAAALDCPPKQVI